MAVRAELVREQLVAGVHAAVLERLAGRPGGFDLPEESLARALERVIGVERAVAASPPAAAMARELATMGYLSRIVEREMFAPARSPVEWLGQAVAERGRASPEGVEALCAELASGEPLSRPDPGGGAPSWRIPGPGGHVRHYLALEAIANRCAIRPNGSSRLPTGIESRGELKRCWLYGFLLRCCAETEDPPGQARI